MHRPSSDLARFIAFCSAVLLLVAVRDLQAANQVEAPGLGDPGTLTSITIETGFAAGQRAMLRGKDSQQQLLTTGHYSSGQSRDLTGEVKYEVAPAGIVSIDATGLALPLADGQATVTAVTSTGLRANAELTVEHYIDDTPVNFPNQVVPIFTKLGCNSGGCHGKSSGQNGFKLSLLGFEPTEDYEHLVKEGRGRRLFPADPDRSLLLLKPINAAPHGGGQRMDPGSHEYKLIRRWIEQGMPYGNANYSKVA